MPLCHVQGRLSTDFREATRITQQPLQLTAPKGSVLMRRVWAGVNASDINYTAGRYFGSVQESERRLPFYAGFEAVGVVAAVGQGVTGGFCPFQILQCLRAIPPLDDLQQCPGETMQLLSW